MRKVLALSISGAAALAATLAMAAAPSAPSAPAAHTAPAAPRAPTAPRAVSASAEAEGERLGRVIEAAIKADGPFFTDAERAVIERKCGYPAGSWDGFEANVSDGVFRCSNGRRVDDAEMRALLAAAEPRIEARVEAAMERADVQGAIARMADEATALALASIDEAKIAREAGREAERAARAAIAEARRSAREARRAADEARRAKAER